MEHKIGEIFEHNGEWYQCVECDSCNECLLYTTECGSGTKSDLADKVFGLCSKVRRSDNKHVIFKKLEKFGKPYDDCGTILQRFRIHTNVTNADTKGLELHIYSNNTIGIEIKQKQEDMEENKTTFPKEDNALTRTVYAYVNGKISDKELIKSIKEMSDEYLYNKNSLKPFSLEAAKTGKPVCTRDGRKARIICFDRRLFYKNVSYPILALVERSDGEDDVCGYNEKGKVLIEDGAEYKDDLMMLPEKRSGWAKVRKDINLYDTKEEADRKMIGNDEYVTAKVCWEE